MRGRTYPRALPPAIFLRPLAGSSAVSGGIALTGVTVSTGGNLASVTATGNVKVSKFLPI
ncbi:MAG TPA: hypothetical protein VFD27_13945 [Chthoniobacteraceae bacterium]|nr:hypothetical protein [Chthoniobacteraceae bacterium]